MKIISVVGARPNFIKAAPLIRAIEKRHGDFCPEPPTPNHQSPFTIHHLLIHTGQHYDYEMSQIFFQDLELPQPDIHLGVGSGTHAEQTAKVMIEFEKVLIDEKPDLVIVVGDVNSTLAAALAAVKLHIPVAHVEAGLRAYDRTMPEEINRLLTDHISDILFTTSKYDDDNLKREGISHDKIFLVGNIMVDSLFFNMQIAEKSNILSRLDLTKQGYALLTLHRPSNVDDRQSLTRIVTALRHVAQRIPVVFPVHPRTQKRLKEFDLLTELPITGHRSPVTNHQSPVTSHQFLLIDPLGYLDFLNLEMNSRFVITDSGGIQVETTVLGTPCLTMLDSPLWPITHKQGTNTLVGSNSHRLLQEAFKILDGKGKKGKCPELWDGKAAERIVGILVRSR